MADPPTGPKNNVGFGSYRDGDKPYEVQDPERGQIKVTTVFQVQHQEEGNFESPAASEVDLIADSHRR